MHLLVGCTLIESTTAALASQPIGIGHSRHSATDEQFEELAKHLNEEAAHQDYSTALRIRWVCKDTCCPNYKEHCYECASGDPMHNHFPLYAPVLTAWVKEICNSMPGASVEKPTSNVVFLMKDANLTNMFVCLFVCLIQSGYSR
jgi:hypothetical protein